MAYQYPAMVAWNPGTSAVVKATVFQVYAPGDTSFASPLAITDPLGNALANLNSGSLGVFPAFQQAQYATVVVSDVPNHTYAWTVPASQVNPVVPWAANTYYTNGQPVVEPGGTVVLANPAHTSASTYAADQSNWTTSQPGVKVAPHSNGADDTTAIQTALNAFPAGGGTLVLPDATYKFTGSLTLPANVELKGSSGLGTTLTYTGAATFLTLSTESRLTDLTVNGTGSTFTLATLNGIFRAQIKGCTFSGQHTATNLQPNETGITLRGNTGDNQIIGCRFNNLGAAIRTDSIMTYIVGTVFSTCQRGIWGDQGSYGAGISLESCTFVSSAAATIAHIQIDVAANVWWIVNSWFEGCTKGLVVGGAGVGGPTNFGMVNCKVASTTANVTLNYAQQSYLANVSFEQDGTATPTDLTVNATNALEGAAINLRSTQNYEIALSTFPPNWSVLNRDQAQLPPTLAGNRTHTGTQLIQPTATGAPPLKVNGPTGLTVNVAEFGNAGTVKYTMDQYGNFIAAANVIASGAAAHAWSGGSNLYNGTGAPTIAGTAGDFYFRKDTPTVTNQRLYVCTVTGAAGTATWVGIA